MSFEQNFLENLGYQVVTCKDTLGTQTCTKYASFCNTGATFNGVDINKVCQRTCQVCDCKL